MILSCDYLGKWEVGGTGPRGVKFLSAVDVMRDLISHGVKQDEYLANTELEVREEEIILLDTSEGVRQELEVFLTGSICDPMAFVNRERSSMQSLSRVLVFTVQGFQGAYDKYNLMFAFQCLSAEPEDMVERLLQVTDNMRSRAPSAVSFPSSFSHHNFATVQPRSAASSLRGSISSNRDQYRKPIPFQVPKLPETKPESLGFDKPSFVYDHSEDQIQKDTILLNYCIDDIEILCKELRNSRVAAGSPSSVQKILADYKATDFISIFQKFKLALNLLGRLHPNIRDPTAAELIHHLFPPLAFLIDACIDLFDEEVQKEVSTPFLTPSAISLLKNSLSSRELLIWDACGDYWKHPKSNFAGSMVPYKPLFHDGWSPGYIVLEEEEPPKAAARRGTNGAGQTVTSDSGSDYGSDGSVYNVTKQSYRPSQAGGQTRGQEEWRDLLMKAGAAIALVTFAREAANKRELDVVKGEYLEILNMERKWWKVRNKNQEIGFVPYTILRMLIYKDAQDFIKEKAAAAVRPPSPRPRSPSPDAAPRRRSQRSPSHRKSPSPRRYQRSPSPRRHHRSPSPSPSPTRRRQRSPSPAESVPPPPPPIPAFMETPTVVRKPSKKRGRSNSVETSYSMADELKHVLSFYKDEKQKQKLDILQTPDIFIDMRSTVKEVQQWLKAKQFSGRVLKYLEGMNGRQVLGMSREALETAFGREEGSRLDSQITLSRNQTKYTQGKNSELRAILEKARRRSEKKKASSTEDLDNPENSHV